MKFVVAFLAVFLLLPALVAVMAFVGATLLMLAILISIMSGGFRKW